VRRFLIGTAGHIDHGKTALVKALTGIDADRLPEEKRRGITIDLGFAHAEWSDVSFSFVDVPGHERFVRNMLAGAGGIQAVLLVVAADESVMPQTREHFEIVRMLGIRSGAVAVTKIDRVPSDLVEVTVSDVRDLVAGSFLEGAPVMPVSARTGEGLDQLKKVLASLANEGGAAEAPGPTRLPIDRAFSIAGFGAVVTGSLVSGSVSREQKLELLPERRLVRVRRVEVHGREVGEARAGERVSANLAGVELAELRRGQTLAPPEAVPVSTKILARLDLLPGSRPLRNGDRVSLHHFASETRARVRSLAGREIPAGTGAPVELRLVDPIAAVPGDRFVIRRLSPVETIGGGVVLDPSPPSSAARGRSDPARRDRLTRLETGSTADRLLVWIEESRERGVSDEDLARRGGMTPESVRDSLRDALASRTIHALRRSPDRYVSEAALARLAARAPREIESLAAAGAGAVGASRRTLLQRLLSGADARWAEAVEAALVARGSIVLAGEEARGAGRDELPTADRDLASRIAKLYEDRGLDPPSPVEAAQALNHRQKVIEGLIAYLVKRGALLRLPGGWIVSSGAVADVATRLRGSGRASVDVGEFKEMFRLTRKLAIPLLEHLDATKVTRRVGDKREILKG
jgi:selenocysteine-specific elongation factor